MDLKPWDGDVTAFIQAFLAWGKRAVASATVTGYGTPLVDGADQSGGILETDGWKPGVVVAAHSILMIGSVHEVSQGMCFPRLRQFEVGADSQADGRGRMRLPLRPPLLPGVTVDCSPPENAYVQVCPCPQAEETYY